MGSPAPPAPGGRAKTPKELDQEKASELIAMHATDVAEQQRSFASERARQLATLADKVASRPGSRARPQSQQEKDQATADAVVAAHQATSLVQLMEHKNERQRQLEKLELAVQSRPNSSARSPVTQPPALNQTEQVSPRSNSDAPSAWGDEPMALSPMMDDEEEWVMTKIAKENHALPVVTRYLAWFISLAVTGGLLFFLYLQLPQTGSLTVMQSVLPMGIIVAASIFLFEPLFLFIIWKSRQAAASKSVHVSGVEQEGDSIEVE